MTPSIRPSAAIVPRILTPRNWIIRNYLRSRYLRRTWTVLIVTGFPGLIRLASFSRMDPHAECLRLSAGHPRYLLKM